MEDALKAEHCDDCDSDMQLCAMVCGNEAASAVIASNRRLLEVRLVGCDRGVMRLAST